MVDAALLNRLLLNLAGYRQDLKSADGVTLEAFKTDIRTQRFIERTLHIAIECCMDICHHIISDQQWREPASYADAFTVLAEQSVLTVGNAEKYRLMAQFRNKLVHSYEKIEPEQVLVIAKTRADDFMEFAGAIRTWIDSGVSGE
jgi:uncharacterized protein YutE (UPF0331/DUF86 family)